MRNILSSDAFDLPASFFVVIPNNNNNSSKFQIGDVIC